MLPLEVWMWEACRHLSSSILATSLLQQLPALLSPLPPLLLNVLVGTRKVNKVYMNGRKQKRHFQWENKLALPFFSYLVGAPQMSLHELLLLESSWLIRLLTFSYTVIERFRTRMHEVQMWIFVSLQSYYLNRTSLCSKQNLPRLWLAFFPTANLPDKAEINRTNRLTKYENHVSDQRSIIPSIWTNEHQDKTSWGSNTSY
jgi:hypothetical protein